MSSEFIGRAMNKDDALRHLPSICTTAVTIATGFMQVMHVHEWTFVGTGDLKRRLPCQCRRGPPRTQGVQPVKSDKEISTGSHSVTTAAVFRGGSWLGLCSGLLRG